MGTGRAIVFLGFILVRSATRNPQRWNRYSYVSNNPINRVDPDGRCQQAPSAPPCSDLTIDVTAPNVSDWEHFRFVATQTTAELTPFGFVGIETPEAMWGSYQGRQNPQLSGVLGGVVMIPGLRGGALRAMQHGANWQGVSLSDTVANVAGKNAVITTTGQKVIYTNPGTGTRVIHDPAGNYFRVQNAAGKYVDQFGKPIPSNVPLVNSNEKET